MSSEQTHKGLGSEAFLVTIWVNYNISKTISKQNLSTIQDQKPFFVNKMSKLLRFPKRVSSNAHKSQGSEAYFVNEMNKLLRSKTSIEQTS